MPRPPYPVTLLDPRQASAGMDALAHNPVLHGPCLGVEVTIREFATACTHGNIDPQHGHGCGSASVEPAQAAITAALDHPLPPLGTTLVTIRPDLDAFGAMAVLQLRACGIAFSSAMRKRVLAIARTDSFDNGRWEDWRPANPPLGSRIAMADIAPKNDAYAALSALVKSAGCTATQAVAVMRAWLVHGHVPDEAAILLHRQLEEEVELWNVCSFRIDRSALPEIVIVHATEFIRLMHFYRIAPVVIAEIDVPGARKVTIAQFDRGWVELAQLAAILSESEPGWGGSEKLIGSPQGRNCLTPFEDILANAKRCLVISRNIALDAMMGQSGSHGGHAE